MQFVYFDILKKTLYDIMSFPQSLKGWTQTANHHQELEDTSRASFLGLSNKVRKSYCLSKNVSKDMCNRTVKIFPQVGHE